MRLFLYGSLRDPATLAELSGDPALRDRWRPAELPGFRVVALRHSRYPTLVRAPAVAPGIIAEVGSAALARLQRYEGASYQLRRVTVQSLGRALPARTWIAPGGTRQGWAASEVTSAGATRTTD